MAKAQNIDPLKPPTSVISYQQVLRSQITKYSLKVKTSKELFSFSNYQVDTQISSRRKTSGWQCCLAPDLHWATQTKTLYSTRWQQQWGSQGCYRIAFAALIKCCVYAIWIPSPRRETYLTLLFYCQKSKGDCRSWTHTLQSEDSRWCCV